MASAELPAELPAKPCIPAERPQTSSSDGADSLIPSGFMDAQVRAPQHCPWMLHIALHSDSDGLRALFYHQAWTSSNTNNLAIRVMRFLPGTWAAGRACSVNFLLGQSALLGLVQLESSQALERAEVLQEQLSQLACNHDKLQHLLVTCEAEVRAARALCAIIRTSRALRQLRF